MCFSLPESDQTRHLDPGDSQSLGSGSLCSTIEDCIEKESNYSVKQGKIALIRDRDKSRC